MNNIHENKNIFIRRVNRLKALNCEDAKIQKIPLNLQFSIIYINTDYGAFQALVCTREVLSIQVFDEALPEQQCEERIIITTNKCNFMPCLFSIFFLGLHRVCGHLHSPMHWDEYMSGINWSGALSPYRSCCPLGQWQVLCRVRKSGLRGTAGSLESPSPPPQVSSRRPVVSHTLGPSVSSWYFDATSS